MSDPSLLGRLSSRESCRWASATTPDPGSVSRRSQLRELNQGTWRDQS
jgi:hypothetical protein